MTRGVVLLVATFRLLVLLAFIRQLESGCCKVRYTAGPRPPRAPAVYCGRSTGDVSGRCTGVDAVSIQADVDGLLDASKLCTNAGLGPHTAHRPNWGGDQLPRCVRLPLTNPHGSLTSRWCSLILSLMGLPVSPMYTLSQSPHGIL